jgi:hypothetical protein
VDGQRCAAGVGVTNRIDDGHEPHVRHLTPGQEAERRSIGKIAQAVQQIGNKNVVNVDPDVLVGRTHYGELGEEVVVA